MWSDVGAIVKGSDHDDSEDSDLRVCQSEKSENLSIDEEDDLEYESLDDIDLESNTQKRMTLSHENIYDESQWRSHCGVT